MKIPFPDVLRHAIQGTLAVKGIGWRGLCRSGGWDEMDGRGVSDWIGQFFLPPTNAHAPTGTPRPFQI